jgi:hypothetical protein
MIHTIYSQDIADRLNMDPEVVEILLWDALGSDHESIQNIIKQLIIQTKLIHPENAALHIQEAKLLAESVRVRQEYLAKLNQQKIDEYQNAKRAKDNQIQRITDYQLLDD